MPISILQGHTGSSTEGFKQSYSQPFSAVKASSWTLSREAGSPAAWDGADHIHLCMGNSMLTRTKFHQGTSVGWHCSLRLEGSSTSTPDF